MKKAEFIENLKSDIAFFKACTAINEKKEERYFLEYVKAKGADEREQAFANYHIARDRANIYREKQQLAEDYLAMLCD